MHKKPFLFIWRVFFFVQNGVCEKLHFPGKKNRELTLRSQIGSPILYMPQVAAPRMPFDRTERAAARRVAADSKITISP
jgi:hypothetical protein